MGETDEIISRILYEMVGNEGLKIINSLTTPKTDIQLHDQTMFPITRIRTTLNTLHEYNIVTYTSSRDEERGWFKYTWQLKSENIQPSTRSYLYSKLLRIKREQQEISQGNFFKCVNGCYRADFLKAYETNFRCEKCKGTMKPVDSAEESRKMDEEIERIKKDLNAIGFSETKSGISNEI